MSNETQHSRNSGDSRRRRSRGGKNNRNQNQDRNRGEQRGHRDQRQSNSNRSEEFRPQGPRPPRGQVPVKLSWWQKLLKAIGLYKAPTRPETKPQSQPQRREENARPPKSNIRNARTNEGEAADEKSGERPERGERGERAERGERPPRKEGRGRDRGGERPRGGDRSTVESPRVYVGNLSYDVTEQDLQELFKGVGPVRNVEIVYNRTTHRSKGYGFVEMLHMDEAIRAVEVLNDQHFMGRKMTVSGAKSKGQDEREDAEERPDRESRPVVLAPLPAVVEESAPAASDDTMIQTIVETVSPEEPAAAETTVEDAQVTEIIETIEETAVAEESSVEEDSKTGVA